MYLRKRPGRVLFFVVLPVIAGIWVLITGQLLPVGIVTGILLALSVAAALGRGGPAVAVPAGGSQGGGLAGWWNRRRRTGFYAAFSVLLMLGLTLAHSALTDTWGGGDLLFALCLAVPLFVILRPPPRARASSATAFPAQ